MVTHTQWSKQVVVTLGRSSADRTIRPRTLPGSALQRNEIPATLVRATSNFAGSTCEHPRTQHTHTVQAQTAHNDGVIESVGYHLRGDAQRHGGTPSFKEGSRRIFDHQVLVWRPAPLLTTILHARCCCTSVERARDSPVASTSL